MVWLPPDFRLNLLMGELPPGVAADIAFRLFCLPSYSEWRPEGHVVLAQRARYYLRGAHWQNIATPVGDLQCYIFEPNGSTPAGTILMVHGWTGEASFMTALTEPARRAGYRVVLFDLPAHGLSEGRSTNLIDCARAVVFVADAFGPFDAIVSHSFGGMITLVAAEGLPPMPHGISSARFVLVASPNRLTDITTAFCETRNMSRAAQRGFERRLERIGHRAINCFRVDRLLNVIGRPALLIHDTEDDAVPFVRSEEIASAVRDTTFKAFTGLGHRNILFASQVARSIVAFLRS